VRSENIDEMPDDFPPLRHRIKNLPSEFKDWWSIEDRWLVKAGVILLLVLMAFGFVVIV
jgi:hypothetical protein